MYLAEMCWQEAETHLKNTDNVIVIPVGSTEQHGSIGPLGTDWMIPQEFARRIADQSGVIVAPPVCYGVAPQHINFPGTVDIGLETMSVLIERMLLCWHRHGARRFCMHKSTISGLQISPNGLAPVFHLHWPRLLI